VRQRLNNVLIRDERGFTLLELLIVLIILGVLLAIAMPSYLSFKDRANKTAAAASLSGVVPDIESYAADNYAGSPTDPDSSTSTTDSGYAGLTFTILKSNYDGSIVTSKYTWDPGTWAPPTGSTTSTDYCVYTVVGVWYAAKHGPDGTTTSGKTMHLSTSTGDCYAS
jgi:type IV pilus assembly protein PilA